jgi:hypothetical protein
MVLTKQHHNWQFENAEEPVPPVTPASAKPGPSIWDRVEGGLNKYEQAKRKVQSVVQPISQAVKDPRGAAAGYVQQKYGSQLSQFQGSHPKTFQALQRVSPVGLTPPAPPVTPAAAPVEPPRQFSSVIKPSQPYQAPGATGYTAGRNLFEQKQQMPPMQSMATPR